MTILVDDLAPQQGAFAHALDWARRLRLPLRGVPTRPYELAAANGRLAQGETREAASPGSAAASLEACAEACWRLGVDWEPEQARDTNSIGFSPENGSSGLVILGQRLPAVLKKDLLRQSTRAGGPAILVCPDSRDSLSRILILNRGGRGAGEFLRTSVEFCWKLQAEAIVLTVGGSEREARLRQAAAREVLAECEQKADFDLIVGSEIQEAVLSVARWRRCQLLLLEQQARAPWWRWLRGDMMEILAESKGHLSFLVLPPALTLDEASVTTNGASLPESLRPRIVP